MPNSSSTKERDLDQPEALKSQPVKLDTCTRLKDTEISVPIVYGNVAVWLGKKAKENSHKWTVYVRGATNEDLGVVIKRAVFNLHSTFRNPARVVDAPPFELSECGWGQFKIAITLFFHSDVCDKPLNLFHFLRLFPEDQSVPFSTELIVSEFYDELVFPEPSDAFVARVQNHPAVNVPRLPARVHLLSPVVIKDKESRERGNTKESGLIQQSTNFSEADELLKLAAAREQVQAHIAKLRRQLSLIDAQPHQTSAETNY